MVFAKRFNDNGPICWAYARPQLITLNLRWLSDVSPPIATTLYQGQNNEVVRRRKAQLLVR